MPDTSEESVDEENQQPEKRNEQEKNSLWKRFYSTISHLFELPSELRGGDRKFYTTTDRTLIQNYFDDLGATERKQESCFTEADIIMLAHYALTTLDELQKKKST